MADPQAGDPKPSEVDTLPGKDKMAEMSHGDLYSLRAKLKTKEAQDIVAPYEHRAFTREYVEENPVTGTLGMVAAIPAYQALKSAGQTSSRSGASLEQAKQAAIGVAEGVGNAIQKPWERAWNNIKEALATAPPTVLPEKPSTKPWERTWGFTPPKTKESPTGPKKRSPEEDAMAASIAGTDTGAGLTAGALQGILGDLEAGRLNDKQKEQLKVALKQLRGE